MKKKLIIAAIVIAIIVGVMLYMHYTPFWVNLTITNTLERRQSMRYFTIAELIKSETADKKAIDNRLPKELLPNAQALVDNVLDPLREAYGKPITVTSGYRCPALNKAVGGSKTSDHMNGCAADIVGTPNTPKENKRLFNLIQELKLPFDQVIDEENFSWVHVSHRREGNRNQVLKL